MPPKDLENYASDRVFDGVRPLDQRAEAIIRKARELGMGGFASAVLRDTVLAQLREAVSDHNIAVLDASERKE